LGARRRAREIALQVLFAMDVAGKDANAGLGDVQGLSISTWSSETRRFANRLASGVEQNREKIDTIIRESSHNWRLERMALVDRNVLRLAVFELLYCEDIPRKVSLNEAIELGKKFGSSDSGAFINGVLDRIARASGKE